ncbi:MAG: hypothetical protein WBW99_10595 [Pseudolabrys sp.]
MKADKIWDTVARVHENVETVLWALLITSVLFFIAFVLPRLPEIRAEIARTRAQEIAAENAKYCQELGMKADTRMYSQCLLTLGDFRLKVEQRIANEMEF